MARFVLLTGKIGAGKSFVADMLRRKRYIVVDSDQMAKSLYNDPEMFQILVSRLGPACLTDSGQLNFDYMREYLLSADPADPYNFAWAVAARLLQKIREQYEDSTELVFIEAALTMQIQHLISWLPVNQAIIVRQHENVRVTRLMSARGMTTETIAAYGRIQKLEYCSPSPTLDVYTLSNIANQEKLNSRLMYILESRIRPTRQEKVALFHRYIRNLPFAPMDKILCNAFMSDGGCDTCPFPCSKVTYSNTGNTEISEQHQCAKL